MLSITEVKKKKGEVSNWIKDGIKKPAVEFAEDFGEYLAENRLSTSQIRNVFGEVKRIQMKGESNRNFDTEVLLLKPKLSYAKARVNGKREKESAEALADILIAGIDGIFLDEEGKFQRFENFAAFFEAVLAYHRAKGGK